MLKKKLASSCFHSGDKPHLIRFANFMQNINALQKTSWWHTSQNAVTAKCLIKAKVTCFIRVKELIRQHTSSYHKDELCLLVAEWGRGSAESGWRVLRALRGRMSECLSCHSVIIQLLLKIWVDRHNMLVLKLATALRGNKINSWNLSPSLSEMFPWALVNRMITITFIPRTPLTRPHPIHVAILIPQNVLFIPSHYILKNTHTKTLSSTQVYPLLFTKCALVWLY